MSRRESWESAGNPPRAASPCMGGGGGDRKAGSGRVGSRMVSACKVESL